jgi:hypothetical protein
MWTHPDAKICYRASDMILNIHSDASYLSAPCACSCAGGYFFLGILPVDSDPIKFNGAIYITCTILKLVATLPAEAELGALFLNAQEAKVLQLTLLELGHPQLPTPIHINNTTTVGIVNNTIKRQRSRAMEMQYFWLLNGKHKTTSNFIISPVKRTWATIHPNTTRLTFINISDHIMCILTSLLQSSHGPLSLAFSKGVLKSLGTHIARSPHYHVLGPSLICLSPQVSLATKYLASRKYSIDYHFHTVSTRAPSE